MIPAVAKISNNDTMNNTMRPRTAAGAGWASRLPAWLLAGLALGVAPAPATEDADRPVSSAQTREQARTQEVERLQSILQAYYSDSAPALPPASPQSASAPDPAPGTDTKQLVQSEYSPDKVYLTGGEGNVVLAQFTRRLRDPRIPELHRDVAPICTVKTRLFDTLVDSERLSLRPVGKNHYIASIKLQPGESTFAIKSQEWQVKVPEDSAAREHIITFYRHPGGKPQLHTFAVEDVLASGDTPMPDWLPDDIAAKFDP